MSEQIEDDNWKVQMSGMLLKRGAGYRNIGERKGFWKRKGAREKKRYFVLVTMAPDMGQPPRAQLRYFVTEKAPTATPKGVVNLDRECRIKMIGNTTMALIAPGRTYYLRPEENSSEATPALSRVVAGKWMYALSITLKGLREWSSSYNTTHKSGTVKPYVIEKLPGSREKQPTRVAERLGRGSGVLKSKTSPGKNQTTKEKKAGAISAEEAVELGAKNFEEIWDSFGWHGYNAIVAYFGPIEIDLERLEAQVLVRRNAFQAELEIYQKQEYRSQDIAADEQKTTAQLLRLMHKGFVDASSLSKHYIEVIDAKVMKPLIQLKKKVRHELESIVSFHSNSTQSIEKLYKDVTDLTETILELQISFSTAMGGENPDKKTGGVPFIPRRKSTFESSDVVALRSELKEGMGMLIDCKTALREEEEKHAQGMKLALRAVHSLQLERLTIQQKLLSELAKIQGKTLRALDKHFDIKAPFFTAAQAVNPEADVQATSDRLLRDIKSFR